jgi:hypothetical protein
MNENKKVTCAVCAWRATCNKKYSITNPSKCLDFSYDVTLINKNKNKGEKDDEN